LATGTNNYGFEEEWLPGHMARFDMDNGALDTIGSYDHQSRPPSGMFWNPIGARGSVRVSNGLYKYGNHLTPGLAEVSSTLRSWPPFWLRASGRAASAGSRP